MDLLERRVAKEIKDPQVQKVLLDHEALDDYKQLTAPEKTFLDECCEISPGQRVECSKLWEAWKAWADRNGHPAGTRPQFGAALRGLVPHLDSYRPSQTTGNRPRFYKGIELATGRRRTDRSTRSTGLSSSSAKNKNKGETNRSPVDRVDHADRKAGFSIPAGIAEVYKNILPWPKGITARRKASAKRQKKGAKGKKARQDEASSE